MNINQNTAKILAELEDSGYEAYLVGGCVRDAVMGRECHDIDITTNARPEEIIRVFKEYKVVPTGLRHGTVTVFSEKEAFEITTYRIDGEYSDSRRPDSVEFTSELEADLARRDFTMNAIAMDRNGNFRDPFGGAEDIKKGVIRCVGEPQKRFTEDALRILRAVRFASQLGFEIEKQTSEAVLKLRSRLDLVSKERIRDELDKLLGGSCCAEILLKYREIIAQIIPELRACFDFQQHSRYHCYDVYEHIARAAASAPEDSILLRRAMLFHDIGKPPMFTLDENGTGHFKGHAQVSAEITDKVMTRLRYDNNTIRLTCTLIGLHSDKIQSERQIKRMVSKLGIRNFLLLLELKKADNSAKNKFVLAENAEFERFADIARRFDEENCCLRLSQLAVNGNDLLELGMRGRKIGETLDKLLELVIDNELPNEKAALLDYIRREENA